MVRKPVRRSNRAASSRKVAKAIKMAEAIVRMLNEDSGAYDECYDFAVETIENEGWTIVDDAAFEASVREMAQDYAADNGAEEYGSVSDWAGASDAWYYPDSYNGVEPGEDY